MTINKKQKNENIHKGSDFDDFLKEEGILEQCNESLDTETKDSAMKKNKKVHISITLSESLVKQLRMYAKGNISKFVEETLQVKVNEMEQVWIDAFKEASQDKERIAEWKEWDEGTYTPIIE